MELALKLQQESDQLKAQELHDAEVAKELERSFESREKQRGEEELGRLLAQKLQEEEEASLRKERVAYIEDRAQANALFYSELPSYKDMTIPVERGQLPTITLKNNLSGATQIDSESKAKGISEEAFCKEIADPNSVLRSIEGNKKLAVWWEGVNSGQNNKNDTPALDMHGLTVAQANHRLYPFLKLTKRYGHKRVVVCCGIGSHSKKGKARLKIMTTKVLDKLKAEKDRNMRLVQSYEVIDGSIHITFP